MKFFMHIGLPKTASTFLQKNVFPKIKNVNFGTPDTGQSFSSYRPVEDKINLYSNETALGSVTAEKIMYNRNDLQCIRITKYREG